MKVLYITDGGPGGVSSHVRCLTQCLKGVAEVKVCIAYRTEALKAMLDEDGTPYVCWNCKNGHDLRLLGQIRKTLTEFNPDVIHFHDIPLFAALYVKVWRWLKWNQGRVKVFTSIHLPSLIHPWLSRRIVNWAAEPCYWLPVSGPNWKNFKVCYPKAQGEVFFNPIRIPRDNQAKNRTIKQSNDFVVGMVGRNAPVKDWPAFCEVVEKVVCGGKVDGAECWGVGVSADEARDFGAGVRYVKWKGLQPNGQEWIGKMNLFVLTSQTEEMPTTVLECFLARTPVCGFIPQGGMTDIISYSNGTLREVFLAERDTGKLADIVCRLAGDESLRRRVIEDGWQILTKNFDAEKNVRGRLMDLYGGDRQDV